MCTARDFAGNDLQLHIRQYIWINYQYDFFTKLAQAKFVVVNAILWKLYKHKSWKKLHRHCVTNGVGYLLTDKLAIFEAIWPYIKLHLAFSDFFTKTLPDQFILLYITHKNLLLL